MAMDLAFSILSFPLFEKICLAILVAWSALRRWKRHFKAGYVDGDELTEGLAHRPWCFPLPFMAMMSTPRDYI